MNRTEAAGSPVGMAATLSANQPVPHVISRPRCEQTGSAGRNRPLRTRAVPRRRVIEMSGIDRFGTVTERVVKPDGKVPHRAHSTRSGIGASVRRRQIRRLHPRAAAAGEVGPGRTEPGMAI